MALPPELLSPGTGVDPGTQQFTPFAEPAQANGPEVLPSEPLNFPRLDLDAPAAPVDPSAQGPTPFDLGISSEQSLYPLHTQSEVDIPAIQAEEEARESALGEYMNVLGLSRQEAEQQLEMEDNAVASPILEGTGAPEGLLEVGEPNRAAESAFDQELDLMERQAKVKSQYEQELLQKQREDAAELERAQARAQQARNQEAEKLSAEIQDFNNTQIDPSRGWHSLSTFNKVRAFMSAAMSLLGGAQVIPAIEEINKRIEQDVAAQRADLETRASALGKKQSLLAINTQNRNSDLAAEALTKAQQWSMAKKQFEIDFGQQFGDQAMTLAQTKMREQLQAKYNESIAAAQQLSLDQAEQREKVRGDIADRSKTDAETTKILKEIGLMGGGKGDGTGKGPVGSVSGLGDLVKSFGIDSDKFSFIPSDHDGVRTVVYDVDGVTRLQEFDTAVISVKDRDRYRDEINGINKAQKAYNRLMAASLDRNLVADEKRMAALQDEAEILLGFMSSTPGVETDKDVEVMKSALGGMQGKAADAAFRILSSDEMKNSFRRGQDILKDAAIASLSRYGVDVPGKGRIAIEWIPPKGRGVPSAASKEEVSADDDLGSDDPSIIRRGGKKIDEAVKARGMRNTGLLAGDSGPKPLNLSKESRLEDTPFSESAKRTAKRFTGIEPKTARERKIDSIVESVLKDPRKYARIEARKKQLAANIRDLEKSVTSGNRGLASDLGSVKQLRKERNKLEKQRAATKNNDAKRKRLARKIIAVDQKLRNAASSSEKKAGLAIGVKVQETKIKKLKREKKFIDDVLSRDFDFQEPQMLPSQKL